MCWGKEYNRVVFHESIQESKEILDDIWIINEIIVGREDLECGFDQDFKCTLEDGTKWIVAGTACEDLHTFLDDVKNSRLWSSLVKLHDLSQKISEKHIEITAHFNDELLENWNYVLNQCSFFWSSFHD